MKLKRGTQHEYNGKRVWVERDRGDGSVVVCYSEFRRITDTFDTVMVLDLVPAKKVAHRTLKSVDNKKEVDTWFESQQVPERCENCNQKLNAFNKFAKRSVCAHILPKKLFPEVATHPMNCMFLGTHLFSNCACHGEWDNTDAEHRKGMRIYPIALKRVQEFIHLIPGNKLEKAKKYLGL